MASNRSQDRAQWTRHVTGRTPARSSQSVVPLLVQHCQLYGLPEPQLEVKFHPVRKWRADLLWTLPRKLIVEVEGGVFVQGRHSRGVGMEKDLEKYAAALALGYPVLRVTPRQVKQGQAVQWIAAYFQRGATGTEV